MTSRHVVALGGSLLRPEEAEQRAEWFGRLRQLAVHMEGNARRLALVIGGGLPAREGITLAQTLVHDSHRLDEVGIAATRLNATVIQQVILDIGCDVAPIIPTTTSEAAALKCLDWKTGETQWSFKQCGFGSLLAIGNQLLVLNDQGSLWVAPASPEGFNPSSKGKILDGKCWTAPVFAHGKLYARNSEGTLVCVSW